MRSAWPVSTAARMWNVFAVLSVGRYCGDQLARVQRDVQRARARVLRVQEVEHRHVQVVVRDRRRVVLGRGQVRARRSACVRDAISNAPTSWPKI